MRASALNLETYSAAVLPQSAGLTGKERRMTKRSAAVRTNLIFTVLFAFSLTGVTSAAAQSLSGTLVVAVPVNEGLVACSDKRAFNDHTGTFDDTFVKIRKVNKNTLFVVTNTIGFLDRSSGKTEFDVFAITEAYLSQNAFANELRFWNGIKNEIRKQLLDYLAKRKFADWPETDRVSNKLLTNLVFFSTTEKESASYTLRVFYEKARTPVVYISNVVREVVRTPKLIGKGKSVIDYLARNPSAAQDPAIQRFDQTRYDIKTTTIKDAVTFAEKLFHLTNTSIPQARVSSTHDCALLSYQNGFEWIGPGTQAVSLGTQAPSPARTRPRSQY
jgi:hypothetical protein